MYVRRASLRKRVREDGPSLEPDSKRAKFDLDDTKASSSNPEQVPEPEAPQASASDASFYSSSNSSASDASFYSSIGDFLALDDKESLINALCVKFHFTSWWKKPETPCP